MLGNTLHAVNGKAQPFCFSLLSPHCPKEATTMSLPDILATVDLISHLLTCSLNNLQWNT